MKAPIQCVMKLSHLQAILVLVTLKLGQGHRVSNLTFRLVSCTWGEKIEVLSQGVMKQWRSQAILVPRPGDLEIGSKSLNVELDIQISAVHMS